MIDSETPLSMEQLGVWRGFLLYRWTAPLGTSIGGVLWAFGVRDRAYVFDELWNRLGLPIFYSTFQLFHLFYMICFFYNE